MAAKLKRNSIFGPGGILGRQTTYHGKVIRVPASSGTGSRAAGMSSPQPPYKGFKVWEVADGFKTSADPDSTFETLRDLKRFIDWQRKNPGKSGASFARCVAEVAAKGGAYDPRAVCAAAGRKKYGAKKYAAMAKAGKKRAARRGNPPKVFYKDVDSRGRERFYHDANVGRRLVLYPMEEAKLLIATGVARVFPKSKRNPASAAESVYEEFHGRPSSETVIVTQPVHEHGHLAALGDLKRLVVDGIDGRRHSLVGWGKAILASNEAKNQLFIRGGDQAIDLAEEFGIDSPHELETLGQVVEIQYFTTKDHLGDEGGTALYFHKAGTTNGANGRHKKVGYGPDLIYRTRNKACEFSGGTYEIKAEGIDK